MALDQSFAGASLIPARERLRVTFRVLSAIHNIRHNNSYLYAPATFHIQQHFDKKEQMLTHPLTTDQLSFLFSKHRDSLVRYAVQWKPLLVWSLHWSQPNLTLLAKGLWSNSIWPPISSQLFWVLECRALRNRRLAVPALASNINRHLGV